jgi:hypothetical protein
MQSVTQDTKDLLQSTNPTYSKYVGLYRNYWNGSSYELATVQEITNDIVDAGKLMWKFDKEGFNVWSVGNVTLTLRNEKQQWKHGNPRGYFPTNYLITGSKIRIQIGTTGEKVYVFTGYVRRDPIMDMDGKTITITVEGSMSVFKSFNAEDISTTVTDEVLGTDSGTVFTTANVGVGPYIIKKGTTAGGAAAATELKPSVDFEVADHSTLATAMTVTLTDALIAGQSLWISYKYWYTNKSIDWIVEQAMILCGITSYTISPIVFSVDIENTWTQTLQADWEADTLINIDTTSSVNSFKQKWFLVDDFSDGQYTTNPFWAMYAYGGGAVTAAAQYLSCTSAGINSGAAANTFITKSTGTWRWKGYTDTQNDSTIGGFWFFLTQDPYVVYTGYGIVTKASTGHAYFARRIGDDYTELADLGAVAFNAWKEWRVTRNSSGTFNIYYEGVLKGTATDTTYAASERFHVAAYSGSAIRVDDIYLSNAEDGTSAFDGDQAASLVSTVQDMTASLSLITTLTAIYTLYGGTVTIYTYTSDTVDFSAGNDPAGYVQIGETGTILSALKRYIKFKILITTVASTYSVTPVVDSVVVRYYTSSTNIEFLDFTGMTVEDLLTKLAELCNYEMAFTASEEFIFRPRSTTVSSVMDFRSSTNVVRLQQITDGVDRIYNQVEAKFGTYVKVADATADAEPNSITKYGKRKYTISSDSLLPSTNANLAYAIAPTVLAYTKNPRRRCQCVTLSLPFLELGDKVTLYYNEPTAFRQWKWGDTDVVWGQSDIEYYDDATVPLRVAFWAVVMRIEGMELEWFNKWESTFDLVEEI